MHITGNVPGLGGARVEIAGGRIRAADAAAPQENWLAPGLVDLQVNGFAGVDFSDPRLEPEQAAGVLPALWATGVTSFFPTLVTNTPEALCRGFRTLEAARRHSPAFDRAVPGYHLEGPYLSPGGARGVHEPRWMHLPDWDEFRRFQEAAGGRIAVVTVAPELPGALDFIARAAAAGLVVAIGHTDCAPEDIHRAADAGARMSTHLGNGCAQMLDRHANPLWAQMTDDRLSAGIICDGFHLPTDVVRTFVRAKGIERLVLVTDATHVATLPPGPYSIASTAIELLPSGKVVKADGACLAGSALGMDRAVANFMRLGGATLEDALRAAAANPARLLGGAGMCAAVATGEPANLVRFRMLDGVLEIEAVWLAGENVYARY